MLTRRKGVHLISATLLLVSDTVIKQVLKNMEHTLVIARTSIFLSCNLDGSTPKITRISLYSQPILFTG